MRAIVKSKISKVYYGGRKDLMQAQCANEVLEEYCMIRMQKTDFLKTHEAKCIFLDINVKKSNQFEKVSIRF